MKDQNIGKKQKNDQQRKNDLILWSNLATLLNLLIRKSRIDFFTFGF